MKKYIALLGMAGLLSMTACDKYLHKDPIGLLTPDIVDTDPTISSIQYSVNSSYQMLAQTLNLLDNWNWNAGLVTRNDFVVYDIASDDANKKWNPDGDQPWMDEVHNYTFIASNGAFFGFWSYQYEGISRCNMALSYLTDEDIVRKVGMDETMRNQLLGETYFLRAFYYFDLVTNFGDVILLTQPIKDFNDAYSVSTRVAKEEIWKLIDNDLLTAKDCLPTDKYPVAEEPWRASKGAVIALQAKAALYREDYQGVLNAIAELESMGYYRLNDNYYDCFDVAKEFTDDEVIFAYNHQEKMIPRNGNGLCALLGWGFLAPTESFIKEFEEGDPRLALTVNVKDKLLYKLLGTLSKDNLGNDDSPSNKIYIRYADVLLWKAEALLKIGNTAEGIDIINQIRERARNTQGIDATEERQDVLPPRDRTASAEQVWQWLIHERRVELGMESHRMRDLRRWHIAKEVLNANGQSFTDCHYLFPIPQQDIDKSGGKLTQNEGY